ncbi:hypothetical protein [Methanoculleus frigidifontis]|nr:hypothetical protein [Methanoculleus sp. FWC-SCC1]
MEEFPNATATALPGDVALYLEEEFLFIAVFLFSVLVIVWLILRGR